jgi:glycosyltransferase involved in cell wall biosynthesis
VINGPLLRIVVGVLDAVVVGKRAFESNPKTMDAHELLVLTSSYPAHADDYRGRFVARLSAGLGAQLGHRVQVLTPRPPPSPVGAPRPEPPRPTDRSDVTVTYVGRGPHGDLPFGRLYGGSGIPDNLRRQPLEVRHLLSSLRATREALRRHTRGHNGSRAPAAIVAHWLFPFGLLAVLEKPHHRRPVWVVCHSGGVRLLARLPAPVRRWVGGQLASRCDLLTFVSAELRDELLASVGRRAAAVLRVRSAILPMGVDVGDFAAVTPGAGPSALRVVCVGRLVPVKGLDRLLGALAELDGRWRRGMLELIGDGPERPRLARLARRLGVDVRFWGEVPPRRLPYLLNGAALAVLPSRRLASGRREGMPVWALESLAAGLPLVCASDGWAVPPSLAIVPGVFLAASGRRSLSRALSQALDHARAGSSEAMVERRRAVDPFDWGRINARAAELARRYLLGGL